MGPGRVVHAGAPSTPHLGDTPIALYAASNAVKRNLGELFNVDTIQEGSRARFSGVDYMTGMAWKGGPGDVERPDPQDT